ncbi:hypothetical protein [Sphingomonas sp. Y38-1Y]|uniref:hypothetical protein n=1 Tax=Sphingomonas sp. Y38-1Y TaxID=3078265 RepID=UPI0028EE584A|nr:hypothetical protein [Sphingomonas sp. Y38-1Y]
MQRPEKHVRGWLSVVLPILSLVAIGIYCVIPHPTYDDAVLNSIAIEAQRLMATYPISPGAGFVEVPQDEWPSVIASLQPATVMISSATVEITTKPFFDGGWGYGFAAEKQSLTMLPECWSHLGHNVYWHSPC